MSVIDGELKAAIGQMQDSIIRLLNAMGASAIGDTTGTKSMLSLLAVISCLRTCGKVGEVLAKDILSVNEAFSQYLQAIEVASDVEAKSFFSDSGEPAVSTEGKN